MSFSDTLVSISSQQEPAAGSAQRVAIHLRDEAPDAMGPGKFEIGKLVSSAGLSTYQVGAQAVGLTFPRCPVLLAEIFRNLAANKAFVGCRGVVERHSDGTPHVHVLLQKTRTTIPTDRHCCYFEGQVCRCHVSILSTRVHQQRWHVYLEKEGVPEQFGQYKVHIGKKGDLELLELAQREEVSIALHEFVSSGGALHHVPNMKRGLDLLTTESTDCEPRFRAPELNITLQPWQANLFDRLNETPVCRRICWVSGPPRSGKTTFTLYLEKHYTGGILNLGFSVCNCNVLHAYRDQAPVIFDFLRQFNWTQMQTLVSMFLELVSEFGTKRRSTKYQGIDIEMCNHLLVFSNMCPIPVISHPDVVHIEAGRIPDDDDDADTLVMGEPFVLGSGVEDPTRARSRSRSPR